MLRLTRLKFEPRHFAALSMAAAASFACTVETTRKHDVNEPKKLPFLVNVLRTTECPADPLRPLASGSRRLGVKIQIDAYRPQVAVNPYYARLLNEQGRFFSARLAACLPEIVPQQLTLGSSAEGWMSFDVPLRAQALTLLYSPPSNALPQYEQEVTLGPLPH